MIKTYFYKVNLTKIDHCIISSPGDARGPNKADIFTTQKKLKFTVFLLRYS
jgi:hypothetical protein